MGYLFGRGFESLQLHNGMMSGEWRMVSEGLKVGDFS